MKTQLLSLILAASCSFHASAKTRIWTDLTGRYQIEASLVNFENDIATFKRDDGTTIAIPAAKLCNWDRDLLKYPSTEGETKGVRIIRGEVIHITDGDTFAVLDSANTPYKVRLYGVDAPELSQEFGTEARKAFARLAFRKTVWVEAREMDLDGFVIGRIYVDDEDIDLKMVRDGFAWFGSNHCDFKCYAEAERSARMKRTGLWAAENQIAPWHYRDGVRKGTALVPPTEVTSPPVTSTGNPPNVTSEDPHRTTSTPEPGYKYWLHISFGVRHNSSCGYYGPFQFNGRPSKGRPCMPDEGRACPLCGG